ncbi:MAG TPA: cytochrome c3 family protein [Planctomycetota bacterium]|nr:cytochrome c3 family protein [Planctomycetota bacterium]
MRKAWLLLSLPFCAVVVALIGLAGCEQHTDRGAPAPQDAPYTTRHVPFNHKVHVIGEEIKCDICHKTAAKEAAAGMPTFKSCNKCHEGIDAKKPPERSIQKFLVDGKAEFSHVTQLVSIAPDTIKFSHKTHVDAKLQCTTCHKGIDVSTTLIPSKIKLTMNQCIDCHSKQHVGENVSNNCQICHTYIDRKWKPESHLVNWQKIHGRQANFVTKGTTESCDLCHRNETMCIKCHRETPPSNHTNFWRERGHGVNADFDRAQCKVCHTEDSCLRCHQTIAPQSHKGTFDNKHCLGCHFPLKEEGCITCHKNTNSHLQAARVPMNAVHAKATALLCRDCHFGPKLLPHADNGDNCLLCHKK